MRDSPIKIILIEPGPITSDIRKNAIPHFEKWIDWEKSALSEKYRKMFIPRLYKEGKKDRFELPASAVTKKLMHEPTVRLKDAAGTPRGERLSEALQDLFDL